jgi:hypothetical protein
MEFVQQHLTLSTSMVEMKCATPPSPFLSTFEEAGLLSSFFNYLHWNKIVYFLPELTGCFPADIFHPLTKHRFLLVNGGNIVEIRSKITGLIIFSVKTQYISHKLLTNRLLVLTSSHNKPTLWYINNGKCVIDLNAYTQPNHCTYFHLLTCKEKNILCVSGTNEEFPETQFWDVTTLAQISFVHLNIKGLTPGGKIYFYHEKSFSIWDINTIHAKMKFMCQFDITSGIFFTDSGVVTYGQYKIEMWDLDKCIPQTISSNFSSEQPKIIVQSSGVVVVYSLNKINFWRPNKEPHITNTKANISCVRFLHSDFLQYFEGENSIIINVNTLQSVLESISLFSDNLIALPHNCVVTAPINICRSKVSIWNLQEEKLLFTLGKDELIDYVFPQTVNNMLITHCSTQGVFKLWCGSDGSLLYTLKSPTETIYENISFEINNSYLLGYEKDKFHCWNLNSKEYTCFIQKENCTFKLLENNYVVATTSMNFTIYNLTTSHQIYQGNGVLFS